MSTEKTGNSTHDNAVARAESMRQAAVTTAGPVQSLVRTADIAHYRSCMVSALATGINPSAFMQALRDLGTGGA